MMDYQHSVILDRDKCRGCTTCMRVCPTEAIRIRDKKAFIIGDRCIDCGQCIRICPNHAKDAVTETLDQLKKFKYNVAIPTAVLYGQFAPGIDLNQILGAFKKLGFDFVYEAAVAADLLSLTIKHIMDTNNYKKPMISSFCPTIIRLIQLRHPSLIDHIVKLETPMEVAARLVKEELHQRMGIDKKDIGAFYITPCPAKVTSIRRPLGIRNPSIDGAIAIKDIYAKLIRELKQEGNDQIYQRASKLGIGWARVGGQSYGIGTSNYIAVDGIENVTSILDEIELGKLSDIDFFEGLACTGGCVGGPLNIENCFIAKTRIRNLTYSINNQPPFTSEEVVKLYEQGFLGWTEAIPAGTTIPLDKDIKIALQKIEQMQRIVDSLPGLDCGSCGAPSCQSLAEDIVRGKAREVDCIFKLKQLVSKM